MKRKLVYLFIVLLYTQVFAQSENDINFRIGKDMYAQFSQYSNVLPILNPAYCGIMGEINFFSIYRKQWIQIENSPQTAAINANGTFSPMIGWGGSIIYESLGAQRYIDFTFALSAIIRFEESNLSFGLNISINTYSLDRSMFNVPPSPKFENILNGKYSYVMPNFGMGLFYYTDFFYAGYSIPELMKYNVSLSGTSFTNVVFDFKSAINFLYLGYATPLDDIWKIKLTGLSRISGKYPLVSELNVSTTYNNAFSLGIGYRFMGTGKMLNQAIIFSTEFQFTPSIYIGYSYDLPAQSDAKFSSHEVRLNYALEYEKIDIDQSIRYW